MIAAYGPYSASATGGNGFARDFLAGIAAMYSVPSEFFFPLRSTLSNAKLSVQQHGHDEPSGVALNFSGVYGNFVYHSHLCLLLERAADSREVPLRPGSGGRSQESGTPSFPVRFGGSRSRAALPVEFRIGCRGLDAVPKALHFSVLVYHVSCLKTACID